MQTNGNCCGRTRRYMWAVVGTLAVVIIVARVLAAAGPTAWASLTGGVT